MPMVGQMLTTRGAAAGQRRRSPAQNSRIGSTAHPERLRRRSKYGKGQAGCTYADWPAGSIHIRRFLTADQVKEYQNKSSHKTGIGADFSQVSGYLYIVSVIKGSPAEAAGLKAGDVIEYVDGRASRDISLYDAEGLVSGQPGTQVRFGF